MPTKPRRPCRAPGCPRLVRSGYCAEHKPKRDDSKYDKKRKCAAKRGYNRKWNVSRKVFLSRHPLCAECGRPAKDIDHIIPHRGNNDLFWDRSNWQALCHECHARKTGKGE